MSRRLQLAASLLLFGLVPAALLLPRLGFDAHHLVDFRNLWQAGRDVLAGTSPYHDPRAGMQATADCTLSARDCFVYPPLAALIVLPLSALPFTAAGAIWLAIDAGALVLALRIAGVRDWRCYGIALGSAPVLAALEGGTLTPLLALGVAAAWRFREHRVVAVTSVGCVVALKLFLLPLLVWLVVTRRLRTAALALVIAASATLVSWASIGFAGLTGYPRLLGALSDVWRWRAYTPSALGVALGLPQQAANAIGLATGVVVLAAAALVTRGGGDGERRAFAGLLVAALLLSPIVWLHYFTLLLIPIAIARPRLGWAWALPVAFLPLPGMADGRAWVIAAGLALAAAASALAGLELRPLVQPPRALSRRSA